MSLFWAISMILWRCWLTGPLTGLPLGNALARNTGTTSRLLQTVSPGKASFMSQLHRDFRIMPHESREAAQCKLSSRATKVCTVRLHENGGDCDGGRAFVASDESSPTITVSALKHLPWPPKQKNIFTHYLIHIFPKLNSKKCFL